MLLLGKLLFLERITTYIECFYFCNDASGQYYIIYYPLRWCLSQYSSKTLFRRSKWLIHVIFSNYCFWRWEMPPIANLTKIWQVDKQTFTSVHFLEHSWLVIFILCQSSMNWQVDKRYCNSILVWNCGIFVHFASNWQFCLQIDKSGALMCYPIGLLQPYKTCQSNIEFGVFWSVPQRKCQFCG